MYKHPNQLFSVKEISQVQQTVCFLTQSVRCGFERKRQRIYKTKQKRKRKKSWLSGSLTPEWGGVRFKYSTALTTTNCVLPDMC